ncbi:hypothetical protein ABBQ32_011758 [Trebouxia sp. C0010 RCD-2024]
MDACPPGGSLDRADFVTLSSHTSNTGDQPTTTFTFTTVGAGPVSRPVRRRKSKARLKWSTRPGQYIIQQIRDRQTASRGGIASASCPQTTAPEGQELLTAFASLSTHVATVINQQLTLNGSETAFLVHPDLEAVRQPLEAQIQQYGVCCSFNLMPLTGHAVHASGLMIQVLQLDLTALHNVDAIVHTVNPQLEVKGTATNAIAAAVGPAFASICSQTLARKGGQLTLKEAAMSTLPSACGSQLHCQHVIHAPLPPCSGFGADDEDCMQCTIHSVLAVATQAGVTSLALPLLGCGLAKWPTELAARAHVQAVFAAAATNLIGTALKKVVFTDLSSEATSALSAELARQAPQYRLSLEGSPAACHKAVQLLTASHEARKQQVQLASFCKLSREQQHDVLQMSTMPFLTKSVSSDGALSLEGDKTLVSQVKCQVERLVAAIKLPYVLQCESGSYPAHWVPQQTNTELFEVDLMSPEVADLVQTFRQQAQLEVVKVQRIQNKKLWNLFALHYGHMQERWSQEPGLHLVNGGLPMLWHGTSATEPHKVYATEQGFTFNFARTEGVWGSGTYYSCQAPLATRFEHKVQRQDPISTNYSAGVPNSKGSRQILAVDVLTGKAKEMQPDSSMRNAPKIEDESIGRLVCCSYLCGIGLLSYTCDSKCPYWDGRSMACCRRHKMCKTP